MGGPLEANYGRCSEAERQKRRKWERGAHKMVVVVMGGGGSG